MPAQNSSPERPAEAVHTSLDTDPSNAARARRFVTSALRGWRLERLADVATLLTSELVTNAILHGDANVELQVSRSGGRLRVEVTDGAAGRPLRRRLSPHATGGRGLELVHLLALDWGVAPSDAGKAVWFELAI